MKKSRHSNYQNIVTKKLNRKIINHDQLRFNWVKKLIPIKKITRSLIDVGSNLGYFCLRFAKELNYYATGYEYEKPTFNKANLLKKKLNNIKYINKGLTIKDLNNLKNADLIIHLNVLHHAGHMYDKKLISNEKDWMRYSIRYLKKLSIKSKYLFFQTGNVNYNQRYFRNEDTFKVIPKILKLSGWKIIKIGNIEFKSKKLYYRYYDPRNIKKIPTICCSRDKKSKKVFYKINNKIIFKYKSGFLQRPLFWCKSSR